MSTIAVLLHPRRAARRIREQERSIKLLIRAVYRLVNGQSGPERPMLRPVK